MRMLRFICSALVFTSLIPLSAIGKEVTVEPGETLSEIADRNNVSVNVLKQLNGITNPNNIKAGEKLNLPEELTLETNKTKHIHTVMNGETLSEIAMKYKIDQQKIINFNNIKSANHLYPGQNLKLPIIKKVRVHQTHHMYNHVSPNHCFADQLTQLTTVPTCQVYFLAL